MNTLVLWFTGLSGSGKTTLAEALCHELRRQKKSVKIIDGDVVRNTLHKNLTFTAEDIKENNHRIAILCEQSIGKYDFILVPVISPFLESRAHARELLAPHFVEVYVRCNLQECIRRDVKGLYQKALAGLVEHFIGIDPQTPYEEPVSPDIVVDTQNENVEKSVSKIVGYICKI